MSKLYSFKDHPEHEKELKPWAQRWIKNAMSTESMTEEDKRITREAVQGLYLAANLTPPPDHRIVFVSSPFVARFAAGFASAIWYMRSNPGFKPAGATDAATRAATRAATDAATDAATSDATYAATYAATSDATRAATSDATYAATSDATRAATSDATSDATDAATYAATYAATKKQWFSLDVAKLADLSNEFGLGKFGLSCAQDAWKLWQGGNQWSAWASYLSFFRHVAKLPIDYSKWDHWEKAAIHSGPRWMHKEFCIISDRPSKLTVDEQNRPHSFDGGFCEWRDGTKLYSIHGVRVPMWIAETPADEFTKEMILGEENVDNRRCIIQKMGIDRAIRVLGAEQVDEMISTVGGRYDLLSIDYDGRGNKRPYLKMRSKSIDADHIEGVEPGVKSVQEAIMYRNGLKVFIEPEMLS